MRRAAIDTNVLVRLIVQDDPRPPPGATRLIEGLASDQAAFVPLVTVVELLACCRPPTG